MNFDELSQLSLKNIANWPLVPKIIALALLFIVILILGYTFDWKNQITDLDMAQQQELKLKDMFLSKKRQAINLETYKQQMKEIEQSFGALLRQLPNKSEMDALLTDINQAGLGRGLEFELFKPAAQETLTEFYAELPINIKVTGSYHDLGAFATDIAKLPRIVTLNDLNIAAPKEGGLLSMEAVARTYRYLDEEEIAAQKKAKAEKEKGGNK